MVKMRVNDVYIQVILEFLLRIGSVYIGFIFYPTIRLAYTQLTNF